MKELNEVESEELSLTISHDTAKAFGGFPA